MAFVGERESRISPLTTISQNVYHHIFFWSIISLGNCDLLIGSQEVSMLTTAYAAAIENTNQGVKRFGGH